MTSHKSLHPEAHHQNCLGTTSLGDCKGCAAHYVDEAPALRERIEILEARLETSEELRKTERVAYGLLSELRDTHEKRADHNAKVYEAAKAKAVKFEDLADTERLRRRELEKSGTSLMRQLRQAEEKISDLVRIEAKLARQLSLAPGQLPIKRGTVKLISELEDKIGHLETSLDAIVVKEEARELKRLKLEDSLREIVNTFEPEPF